MFCISSWKKITIQSANTCKILKKSYNYHIKLLFQRQIDQMTGHNLVDFTTLGQQHFENVAKVGEGLEEMEI